MNLLNNKRAIALFLLPGLLLYTVIVFVPIVESLYYGFFKWNGVSEMQFIGLNNYRLMFRDRVFIQSLKNNLFYILMVMSVQVGFGLLLAILVTYLTRGREVIRTAYYVPAVINSIAIVQLFRSMYSYEPVGLFNSILIALGAKPIAFLSDYTLALPCVSMVEGWQYIGVYMIIFYSALVSISSDLSEAARIDGASEWQLFWRVRVPLMKNVIGLALILSLVGALRGFTSPMLLTQGGPGSQTEIMATYMYKKAFLGTRLGYGSAVAVIIVALSLMGVSCINAVTSRANT